MVRVMQNLNAEIRQDGRLWKHLFQIFIKATGLHVLIIVCNRCNSLPSSKRFHDETCDVLHATTSHRHSSKEQTKVQLNGPRGK